jgi:hypothetical protein
VTALHQRQRGDEPAEAGTGNEDVRHSMFPPLL